jgi:plastocyanin
MTCCKPTRITAAVPAAQSLVAQSGRNRSCQDLAPADLWATSVPTTNLSPPVGRRQLPRRVIASGLLSSAASRYAGLADAKVMIDNFAFSPTPLRVARGTTVIWENRDEIPHAVYFPTLNVHSNVLDTDDTFHCRFDQGGYVRPYLLDPSPHARPDRGVGIATVSRRMA